MKKREVKAVAKFENEKSEDITFDDNMSESSETAKFKKQKEEDEAYFQRTMNKIDEIKAKLKTAKQDGMDVKMRQKLRNQVSAQQSRIKKKQEVLYLKKLLDDSQKKYKGIMQILDR